MKRLVCILLLLPLAFMLFGEAQEGIDQLPPASDVDQGPVFQEMDPLAPSPEMDQGSVFQWAGLPFSSGEGGDGLLEGEATSDGLFRLRFKPDLSVGKFSIQFDVALQGQLHFDPFDITLNFEEWLPPDRGELSSFDYASLLFRHYSRFIRSMQWGAPYQDFYLRWGKLLSITMGDGALINGYYDAGAGLWASRPGLELMVDLSSVNVANVGFHYVVNDVFDPALIAWRLSGNPLLRYEDQTQLSQLEMGFSFAHTPPEVARSKEWPNLAFFAADASYPLLRNKLLNINIFGDLIGQTKEGVFFKPAMGWRWGIWGHSASSLVFNASITNAFTPGFYIDYYSPGFERRNAQGIEELLLPLGTTRLDATISMALASRRIFVRSKMASLYTDGSYHSYQFVAGIHIERRVFNIVSLDFTYEKLYPTSMGERFFEGLLTLRNVVLNASAVLKMKPYTVDLGLSTNFDDQGTATFTLSTAVRVTIL
jgi:hypothetical protein